MENSNGDGLNCTESSIVSPTTPFCYKLCGTNYVPWNVGNNHGKNGNRRREIGDSFSLTLWRNVYTRSEKSDTNKSDELGVSNKETFNDNRCQELLTNNQCRKIDYKNNITNNQLWKECYQEVIIKKQLAKIVTKWLLPRIEYQKVVTTISNGYQK